MFPLNRRVLRRFLFVFALSLLLANVAVADVELKASWTKGREHWLVHIQVARGVCQMRLRRKKFYAVPDGFAMASRERLRTFQVDRDRVGFGVSDIFHGVSYWFAPNRFASCGGLHFHSAVGITEFEFRAAQDVNDSRQM